MNTRLWTFRQFRSLANEKDSISDWRKRLSPARRATLDIFIDRIAKMSVWPRGICDPIRGKKYKGYWELRWTAEKVEHRIFGYFSGQFLFVMLVGCTHKGKVYDPPSAFETMKDLRRKLDDTKEGMLSVYEPVRIGGDEEQGIPPRPSQRSN
jgi:hypothetical protein